MRYEQIVDMPRPASRHSKISALDRAAQFSAFAALAGLDEQMDETARLVNNEMINANTHPAKTDIYGK